MFLVGSFKRVQCLGSYLLFGWRVGRELIHLFLDVVCYVVRASFGRSFFPGPYSSIWVHCTLWWPQNQYIYSTAEGCGGSFKKEIYGEVGCCESCTDGSNLLSLPLSICISLYLYLCQKVCQGPQKQKLRAENRKSQRTDPGDVNARAQLCMDFCAPFILPSMRAIFLFIRDSMVFGDLGMT